MVDLDSIVSVIAFGSGFVLSGVACSLLVRELSDSFFTGLRGRYSLRMINAGFLDLKYRNEVYDTKIYGGAIGVSVMGGRNKILKVYHKIKSNLAYGNVYSETEDIRATDFLDWVEMNFIRNVHH